MFNKSRQIVNLILCIFLVVGVAGCTYIKLIARGNQPIVLNTLPEKYIVLGHFKKSKGVAFDYTGAPDISSIIREAVTPYPNADAVVNTFVTVEESVGDFFFDFFTLGIANAHTITVEGDIIKYAK